MKGSGMLRALLPVLERRRGQLLCRPVDRISMSTTERRKEQVVVRLQALRLLGREAIRLERRLELDRRVERQQLVAYKVRVAQRQPAVLPLVQMVALPSSGESKVQTVEPPLEVSLSVRMARSLQVAERLVPAGMVVAA